MDTSRKITLPYGAGAIELSLPAEKLVGIFAPRSLPALPDPARAVRDALTEPVGAAPRREQAKGAKRIAIAIEDATRPVPSAMLLDAVMEALVAGGVSPGQVTIVATVGLHRPRTAPELSDAPGRWQGKVRAENHDARDSERLLRLGTTSMGTNISINRTFMEAGLKITTGDVEYHQIAGYGGGVKCVYPGRAGADAIQTNHSRMDLPGTGPGRIDGNPVRGEIDEVGRMAGVDFNLSVAMDAEHRIVAVCAGGGECCMLAKA